MTPEGGMAGGAGREARVGDEGEEVGREREGDRVGARQGDERGRQG